MTDTTHQAAEEHTHTHGDDCGHEKVVHLDHVDYLHDGHRHAAHEGHYDEHGEHPHTLEETRPRTEVTP